MADGTLKFEFGACPKCRPSLEKPSLLAHHPLAVQGTGWAVPHFFASLRLCPV
jgi:hypothetical protein